MSWESRGSGVLDAYISIPWLVLAGLGFASLGVYGIAVSQDLIIRYTLLMGGSMVLACLAIIGNLLLIHDNRLIKALAPKPLKASDALMLTCLVLVSVPASFVALPLQQMGPTSSVLFQCLVVAPIEEGLARWALPLCLLTAYNYIRMVRGVRRVSDNRLAWLISLLLANAAFAAYHIPKYGFGAMVGIFIEALPFCLIVWSVGVSWGLFATSIAHGIHNALVEMGLGFDPVFSWACWFGVIGWCIMQGLSSSRR